MDKKKIISAIVSASIFASCFAVMPVNAESSEVFNDGFETGYNGWASRGDANLEVVSGISHSGDSSLKVTGRTIAWHGACCAKILELQPGKTYDLSAWVMYEEGNQNEQFNLKLLYKDANGKENYKDIASVNASKGQWAEIKRSSYTVPSDATGVTIYVETPSSLIDFYIDDISAYGDPIDYDSLSEGFSDDFENGNGGWSGRGSATSTIVTDESHSGTHSLYTTGRKQIWNGAISNKTLNIYAGHYYKFGGWVMYNDDKWGDTHKFSINLQYQQNGKEVYYTAGNVVATKGEWTYVEAEYILPKDASNFSVYFQTGWVPDASLTDEDLMDFYIDDITAERLPDPEIQSDIASLKDVYADYFKLGCAASATELAPDVTKDLIKKHYNSFTFGNELKPDATLNYDATVKYMQEHDGDQTNPQISLASAKSQLEFCRDNNIPVRGHCLVWHSQTPDWFFKENYDPDGDWVSKDVMIQRMENYIKNIMTTIAEEYPTVEFYAWDVVNEAFTDSGTVRPAGSNNAVNGQSAWVSVFGDNSFIDYAFEFARKYAPENCKLFYNDYNEYTPAKRDAICEKAKELKEKGLIDGIGMQSHIKMSYPSIALYQEAIQKYSDLGLEVQITELDIDQKNNDRSSQLELAKRYQEIISMYKKMKDDGANITAVVLWGITDSTSWIGGYPLLFNKNYQAKDAFYAVADTDSELQLINTVSAVEYGSADELKKAFEVQAENVFGDVATFKLAWKENILNIQVTAKKDIKSLRFVTDAETTATASDYSLKAGETGEYSIPFTSVLSEIKDFGFDIIADGKAWNDLSTTADNYTGNYGLINTVSMPAYTEAVKGTPEIDGKIDDKWADANTIDVNVSTLGQNPATAKVKTLWDENYIYVLAEVKDPVLNKDSINAYEQDSLEVFFDENNNKTSAYQSDDIQCRINFDNEKSVTDGLSTDNFISATSKTDDGYIVEVAIPYTIAKFTAGQVVGFDAQVNDADASGARTGISNWSDLTGLGYTNTSQYGVLKLAGDNGGDVPTPSTDKKGDVNCDGKVNIADLFMLAQQIAGIEVTITDQGMKNADVTGDSSVNISDLFKLAQYISGLTTL